ncbi:MAG TPA: fasciclin domain-containing protein [Nocardioidaceae bacterium]|nr:fasciclin domain-containing protein [Nocardioidaceae bacterium]
MKVRTFSSVVASVALAGSALAVTAPAQADDHKLGTRSLAKVLAADGSGFDKTAGDFDILDNAVSAVLAAKPKSAVAVLADGKTALTAFAPTDGAFRRLVEDLTGSRYHRERKIFNTLADTAGIDTIESVLLYHVVPGATVTYRQAKASGGAKLDTALEGATLRVRVRDGKRVFLADADKNDPNARVLPRLKNINHGNRQIAHGISWVLRPADL